MMDDFGSLVALSVNALFWPCMLAYLVARIVVILPCVRKAASAGIDIREWGIFCLILRRRPASLLVDTLIRLKQLGGEVGLDEIEDVYGLQRHEFTGIRDREGLVDRLAKTVLEERLKADSDGGIDAVKESDPVAGKTGWRPVARQKGTPFRTHRLVWRKSERMELCTSITVKVVMTALSLAVFGGLAGLLRNMKASGETPSTFEELSKSPEGVVCLLLSILGCFTVWAIYGHASTWRRTFDKRVGFFWTGRVAPSHDSQTDVGEGVVRLEDIHAIQLVAEYITGEKGKGYTSYELNLVLENGKRINVIDHASRRALRRDAKILAKFLEKPLWDTIAQQTGM